MDTFQDSLNYIKNDIYEKLDVILDDLKVIQAYIYWLRCILYLTEEHIE